VEQPSLRYGSPAGRWVLFATVLGSGIAFLDSTVVNVALPQMDADLEAGVSGLQWTLNSYLLTLSALLLLGGSLGDLYGRRKMFVAGLVGFGAASAMCTFAPTIELLVVARAVQGIAAALLVPGSLAIISASFQPDDRAAAIGAWSGLSGVATAFGPFIGGWLVDAWTWRLVFLINIPLVVIAIFVTLKHVPETRDETAEQRVDISGAIAAALGLGGIVYALIEGPVRGWGQPIVLGSIAVGVLASIVFVVVEMRSSHPMLPLRIFRNVQFSAANATTLVVYAALGGALFLLVVQLQESMGYSALEAGAALFPLDVLLLVLSPRVGRWSTVIGPRIPMTIGPIVAGVGIGMLVMVEPGASYVTGVLPPTIVFALGMAFTVAPLTATVLGAVESRHAGIASGVNNAVARTAGLLAVALLPLIGGFAGKAIDPDTFTDGFHRASLVSGALCVVGGFISWAFIRGPGTPCEQPPPGRHHPPEAARPAEDEVPAGVG
jgi:EmrB/QacA subfamily drug resistance transporter